MNSRQCWWKSQIWLFFFVCPNSALEVSLKSLSPFWLWSWRCIFAGVMVLPESIGGKLVVLLTRLLDGAESISIGVGGYFQSLLMLSLKSGQQSLCIVSSVSIKDQMVLTLPLKVIWSPIGIIVSDKLLSLPIELTKAKFGEMPMHFTSIMDSYI